MQGPACCQGGHPGTEGPKQISQVLCGRAARNYSETKLSKSDKPLALLLPGGFGARFFSPSPLTSLQPEARSFSASVSTLIPRGKLRLSRGAGLAAGLRLSLPHGTEREEQRGAGRGVGPAFLLAWR